MTILLAISYVVKWVHKIGLATCLWKLLSDNCFVRFCHKYEVKKGSVLLAMPRVVQWVQNFYKL